MPKRRLLLADDSITIQKVVNLTFADEGIEVVSVGDGDAAMEKFVQATPDLVMVDVNMPGFDGYKICEIIKQDEETKHIPVILLVGSFEPFDEEEARRVGADDYLTKPFQSIRQLVGKVTDLLDLTVTTSPAASEETAISKTEEETTSPSAKNYDQIWSQTNSDNEVESSVEPGETAQTNQIDSLPADESQKFSSDSPVEEKGEINFISAAPQADENVYELTGNEDLLGENTNDADENSVNNFFESVAPSEQNREEDAETVSVNQDKNAQVNEETSLLEIDDVNLLDLSPINKDDAALLDFQDETIDVIKPFEQNEAAPILEEQAVAEQIPTDASTAPPVSETQIPETQPEVQSETPFQASDSNENLTRETNDETHEPTAQHFDSANITPEIIDAIAERVIEKLSDKVIREIAWEVVPPMADLIVQKIVEEKLKS